MKVLFIGLNYHTYTQSIVAEMRTLGASVRFVHLQPRNLFCQVLRTSSPSVFAQFRELHHRRAIAASAAVGYDQVVFLQAHPMSLENLARLRDLQPRALFTLYNWDSLQVHDYRPQAPFFDRVLTFDRQDAERYGFGYLPLFCQRSMQGLRRDCSQPRSIFMVGNIGKLERYRVVEEFRRYCARTGIVFRQHLKISPVVGWRLLRAGIWPRKTSLRSIPATRFEQMIESAGAVFDCANHSQAGMTMRLMESLCAGKKIVTNNQAVTREPFFSPDRIHLFAGTEFEGVDAFLQTPLADPTAQFPEYHVQHFTRRLLGLEALQAECAETAAALTA